MTSYIYSPVDFNNNPPRLSMYGLSNSVFNISNPGDNFGLDTRLVFPRNLAGEQPETVVNLKINSDTSKILLFADTVWSNTITQFYHIIYDPDVILSLGLSDNSIGLVEYTYNSTSETLESNILADGKFTSNKYSFDSYLWELYQDYNNLLNFDIDLSERNISNTFLNNIIGYAVDNVRIIYSGGGYKLNSTFFLNRSIFTSDLLLSNCTLDAKLCLDPNTVVISGGINYSVGDTFTIGTLSQANMTGTVVVKAVSAVGAILQTEVINNGLGFTSLPTVISNSNHGANANISVNDSFGIGYCDVINHSNGYTIYDNIIGCKFNNVEYNPTIKATATTEIKELKIVPLLQNNFSLHSVSVKKPGNNISSITFDIVSHNNIVNNQYITTSPSNLIDTKNVINNRPRFFI